MKKLCFAYDTSPVQSKEDCLEKYKYVFCSYSQKYIPINGSIVDSVLNFRRSGFYASIDDIFKDLPFEIEVCSVEEAIGKKTPFIYYASMNLKKSSSNAANHDNSLSELFSRELIESINSGQCLLCLDTCEEVALSRYEQREVGFLTLLERAGIYNIDNVKFLSTIVHGNSMRPKVEPVLWDCFIRTYREKCNYNIDYTDKVLKYKSGKGYRFLFLNNKLKFFRILLFYLLYTNTKNFKEQFIATLCPTDTFFYGEILSYNADFKRTMDIFGMNNIPEVLRSFYNIDTTQTKVIASHKLKKLLGLQEPSYKSKEIDVGSNIWQYTEETWQNAGINIITENTVDMYSSSEGGIFLTEKTYKPIAYKLPFIIYGQPYTLRTLHNKGFKTFSDFWSEEYDTITDPLKRVNEIVRVVKEISFLSDDAFIDLLSGVQEIIEYNFNHMMQNYDPEIHVKRLFEKYAF